MGKIRSLANKEEKRQKETLMMIPSENYTYPQVREVVGSWLMHKYAEGQPKARFYQGMGVVDEIELLCEKRALEAFDLNPNKWHVNVQPYSGTPANLAVYNALLTPGDPTSPRLRGAGASKIMAMFLPDGGHLSHGWQHKGKKITFTSKIFDIDFYHVDSKTNVFDYDQIEKQAVKTKPKLIISGGTAYPREINHRKMGEIARKVGAYYLADIAHEAGLVVGGVNKSPFAHATAVTMTTHKTLRGPRGALAFVKKEFANDLDKSVFPGLQGGPHIHTIAGIAIALSKSKGKHFASYASQTVKNAQRLARKLSEYGLDIVSGGTDKHMVLVDLRDKKINGWYAAWALEAAGIVVNKNTIPNDTGSPFYPSGIRLGTPAITVRGMKEKEIDVICDWIVQVLEHVGPRNLPESKEKRARVLHEFKSEIQKDGLLKGINLEVRKLCRRFPVN